MGLGLRSWAVLLAVALLGRSAGLLLGAAFEKPRRFTDQRTIGMADTDKKVLDVLSVAPMALSAITVGRRLGKRPCDVVDALERLEERGKIERDRHGPNGLTYRVKR